MRRSTFTDQPVTYGAVGATAAEDLLTYPPAGYRPAEDSLRIGSGEERFHAATDTLMTWGVQKGAGFTVTDVQEGTGQQYQGIVFDEDGAPSAEQRHPVGEALFAADGTPYIRNGMSAVLRRRIGPFAVAAPVRVVQVVDEPMRSGFAYGSLPGHPVNGEEAFIVELRDDGAVWFTIRSFSRPAHWYLRLGTPIARALQRRITREYLRALLPRERLLIVPSTLPLADPAPADGRLPASVLAGAEERAFGVYLHVPFCTVRCGYCDFNTYTAQELRGVQRSDYANSAIAEIGLAERVIAEAGLPHRPASTVFFGGGTPTLLPVADLARMLDAVRDRFGLADDAEVTVEANPDTVDSASLRALARSGVTRVSVGMQSAVPRVLAVLDRTHAPERVPAAVAAARDAGLQVSVDLIYGSPGETLGDWRTSLESAMALRPDHLSAYALIVEDGTRLARSIRRGELPSPDDDLQAEMYELADALLGEAGYSWYEVSNWSSSPSTRSRHNLAYWRGADWWGVGPGAHSHVGGVRWWNAKHPAAYADRLASGGSPAVGRESLGRETRRVEEVLLGVRLRGGLSVAALTPEGRRAVAGLIAEGLVEPRDALAGRVVLTLRGRLLADGVVHRLLD